MIDLGNLSDLSLNELKTLLSDSKSRCEHFSKLTHSLLDHAVLREELGDQEKAAEDFRRATIAEDHARFHLNRVREISSLILNSVTDILEV